MAAAEGGDASAAEGGGDRIEETVPELYGWMDSLPLSRPKRNLPRDFADGVLMAEVANHCVPRIAELHNYSAAHSFQQKKYNWRTLNEKVFSRVGLKLSDGEIEAVIRAEPGAVERVIGRFRTKAQVWKRRGREDPSRQGPPRLGRLSSPSVTVGLPSPARASRSSQPASIQEWAALVADRDNRLRDAEDCNAILTAKCQSLEKLLQLRDARIELLSKALEEEASHAQEEGPN